jgi:hypothetical protein
VATNIYQSLPSALDIGDNTEQCKVQSMHDENILQDLKF